MPCSNIGGAVDWYYCSLYLDSFYSAKSKPRMTKKQIRFDEQDIFENCGVMVLSFGDERECNVQFLTRRIQSKPW